MTDITRDNSHYRNLLEADPTSDVSDLQLIANDRSLPENVRQLICGSISANTRRAYRADLIHFGKWGGSIPATPAIIASYLADHSLSHSTATLRRRIASLSRAHLALGLPDPTKIDPAKSTMRGISRTHGSAVRSAAPLLRNDLFNSLDKLGVSTRDVRDRALLTIGFAGGFRRSELVGLDVADLNFTPQGIIVTIRRSKTDQDGKGRILGIPTGRSRHCPVQAAHEWIVAAQLSEGPLFRSVTRRGKVCTARLSSEMVSIIVKRHASAIGLSPQSYSGHSLRAGFVTSAAKEGASSWKIRQQTGHKSDAMLARYIRFAELFEGNAGHHLF